MTNLRQILVAFAVIQWAEEVKCIPFLQGVKITRDINIDLKPFQFKPFSYIMEKWGPFGAFGKKYGIAKRDVDTVSITPPPLQASSELYTAVSSVGPALARPAPVIEVTPDNPPPAVVNISPIPISSGTPPTVISNDIFQDVIPVTPINRVIGSDFNFNRLTGLNTDISRIPPFTQINNNPTPVYDNDPLRVSLFVPQMSQPDVTASVVQPAPETPSRGGIIARLFGEFILQLFSRLINSARSSFGQLSSRTQ